jgi:uncharacterized protein (TIGR03083 family)
MSDVFTMIADERRLTADMLDNLTDEQWNTESLCTGWRVREVASHLVMPFSLSVPGMMLKLIANRFDLDKVSDRWARDDRRTGAELASSLRSNAEHRFTPPGLGPEAPLTDIVVHTQDMCRPLGIDRAIPPERARVVLDFLVSPKAARGFIPKGLTEGLQFTATDTGWQHGAGVAVSGSAADLMLTISGRTRANIDLSGDGVDTLLSRLAA